MSSDRDVPTMTAMIVVAGEALIDRIVRADGSVVDRPGGAPFNAARTIARLGVPVTFVGALSTDPAGVNLRNALAADRVDLSHLVSTDAHTTLAVARLDASGTATYEFATAGTSAVQLAPAALRSALAARPRAFHLGSLGLVIEPLATTLDEVIEDVAHETLVMVDPNCRPSAIPDRAAYLARLLRIIARADIVKASRDDLDYLWPGVATALAAHRILATGPLAAVVTDGDQPVSWVTPEWSISFEVPQGPVVDTIGAGDAFGGALVARWIDRGFGRAELLDVEAVRDAVRLAIEVARLTCGRAGADPPRRDEVAWGLGRAR